MYYCNSILKLHFPAAANISCSSYKASSVLADLRKRVDWLAEFEFSTINRLVCWVQKVWTNLTCEPLTVETLSDLFRLRRVEFVMHIW